MHAWWCHEVDDDFATVKHAETASCQMRAEMTRASKTGDPEVVRKAKAAINAKFMSARRKQRTQRQIDDMHAAWCGRDDDQKPTELCAGWFDYEGRRKKFEAHQKSGGKPEL
jgi:hypothetical protein